MLQQIFSLLHFPILVLSSPDSDPDYLTIHLHSNKSTGGEVIKFLRICVFFWWIVESCGKQVDLDIHPSQLEGPSISPKSAAGGEISQLAYWKTF